MFQKVIQKRKVFFFNKGRKKWNLDAEIAVQGDIVGLGGEEVAGGGAALDHHLALLAIEIGRHRRQIKLREERPLQHRVHAMHRAQLRLLYLVVQHPPIAGPLHFSLFFQTLSRRPKRRNSVAGKFENPKF